MIRCAFILQPEDEELTYREYDGSVPRVGEFVCFTDYSDDEDPKDEWFRITAVEWHMVYGDDHRSEPYVMVDICPVESRSMPKPPPPGRTPTADEHGRPRPRKEPLPLKPSSRP